ncbi:MAG: hypothetical protein B7X50_03100 [Alishewanella sp. 34-51-39]|nr:MAG: hypothetical protein B7X50_03100 [Alishewanella sp. 34-51-39]
MSEPTFMLQLAGRHYRLKATVANSPAAALIKTELEQRLATAAAQSPLANRDQLLVLTAVNLVAELLQQQTLEQQQLRTLLTTIRQAD